MKIHDVIHILEKKQNKIFTTDEIVINSQIFIQKFKTLTELYCMNNISYLFYMDCYNKALTEARKNKIKSAERHIKKAKNNVNFSNFSNIEINVFNILTFTIDAYLLYKKGNYIGSIEKTFEVMELDNLFESKFPFIYFHKIQQLHNLSRVYLKNNDFNKFTKCINLLFQNLLFNCNINFENQKFESKDLKLNLELRSLMTYQVFYETIYVLEKHNKSELHYFNNCFKTIINNKSNELVFEEFRAILHWVNLKKTLLNDKSVNKELIQNYLNTSNNFVDKIPTESIIRSLKNNFAQHN